jgi:cell division septal protein FtsQ
MSVKAPTEKNFRRARVKPGKRRGSRARVWWRAARIAATVTLVGYSTYRAFDLVVNAGVLKIRSISVAGNVRLSAGEVHALADGIRGTSILTAIWPRTAAAARIAMGRGVALRRVLPSTIEVFVSERTPIGLPDQEPVVSRRSHRRGHR